MSDQQAALLHVVHHEGVRLLTLHRPEARNAFSIDLYRALSTALVAAGRDRAVGALVLTGAGSAFCAGTDLGELAAVAAGNPPAGAAEAFPGLLDALGDLEVPLLAAVNGPGVGVGFTILSFCDLVFMSKTARLKAPFVELGVPPEAASSYLFPRRMGWQRAAHALLTGEWLSASEALAAGIATEVCEPGEVVTRALEVAAKVAAAPGGAARTIKRLMQAGERDAIAAARRRENAEYVRLYTPVRSPTSISGEGSTSAAGSDRPGCTSNCQTEWR